VDQTPTNICCFGGFWAARTCTTARLLDAGALLLLLLLGTAIAAAGGLLLLNAPQRANDDDMLLCAANEAAIDLFGRSERNLLEIDLVCFSAAAAAPDACPAHSIAFCVLC
jgi:hypothetical protein